MIANTQTYNWIERFPGLSQLDESIKEHLLARSEIIEIATGSRAFEAGKISKDMLFLLKGTVRVQQTSSSGRQIVLYRIHAGESCVMTSACLFSYQTNTAEGIAEVPVEVASIPKLLFDELLAKSAAFRDFVFYSFSKRVNDLLEVVDDVAFKRLDVRLAHKLLELSNEEGEVITTHQKMSIELGSAREVISRQLQFFQQQGWIETSRGKINIIDRPKLLKLSQENN